MRAGSAFLSLCLIAACGASPSDDPASGNCGLSGELIGAFVEVPGGVLQKGRGAIYPEEKPAIDLHVDGFRIQVHEVTNNQFAEFVAETGYVTDAERGVIEGRSGAGSAVFQNARWHLMHEASWKKPDGASSTIEGKGNLPVVHVSLADAMAYAAWAGGRLPSEEEWEYAARLGLPDPERDTSGAFEDDGTPRANTWQGIFPVANAVEDGFAGAAPVGCFPTDRIGLSDMIGNVWEWTDTPFAPNNRTIKGGSYLCADNFCQRYRPAARHPQEIDFSSNHIGFRIVKDLDAE